MLRRQKHAFSQSTTPSRAPYPNLNGQGGPGSVRFGYGLKVERFERFRFSILAVPLSQGTQPPLTWTTEVECQTPARSTSPNSCSTGPALWRFFRKSAVLQGKRPGVQRKRWPQYRYCFSCLKVRGGSLYLPTLGICFFFSSVFRHNLTERTFRFRSRFLKNSSSASVCS